MEVEEVDTGVIKEGVEGTQEDEFTFRLPETTCEKEGEEVTGGAR